MCGLNKDTDETVVDMMESIMFLMEFMWFMLAEWSHGQLMVQICSMICPYTMVYKQYEYIYTPVKAKLYDKIELHNNILYS